MVWHRSFVLAPLVCAPTETTAVTAKPTNTHLDLNPVHMAHWRARDGPAWNEPKSHTGSRNYGPSSLSSTVQIEPETGATISEEAAVSFRGDQYRPVVQATIGSGWLSARMMRFMQGAQSFAGHVSVDLCSADVGMSQHGLYCTKVRTMSQ